MLPGFLTSVTALLAVVAPPAPATAATAAAVPRVPQVRFAPAQTLLLRDAALERITESVSGGLDGRGRGLLVWSQRGRKRSTPSRLVMATAPANGRFGAPRRIRAGSYPQVAIAPDGRAILAYATRDQRGSLIATANVDGTVGPEVALAPDRRVQHVVIAPDGVAAVTTAGDEGTGPAYVQLVDPEGRPGPPQRIASEGGPEQLVAGPDGRIAILGGGGVVEREPGATSFGPLQPLRPLKEATLKLALGPGSKAAVVAQTQVRCNEDCVGDVLFAQRRGPGEPFGEWVRLPVRPRPSDGERIPTASDAELAYDGGGTPVVTWREDLDFSVECDMCGSGSATYAWRGRRTRLRVGGSRFTTSMLRIGRGLAALSPQRSRAVLWPVGGRRPAGTAPVSLMTEDTVLAAGGGRVLVAGAGFPDPPLRASLGTVAR